MNESLDITDIVIEALEVVVNQVLYMRQVYPPQVFQKRRIYNTPIFGSVYPPLNTYLQNVLRTARELLQSKQLQCAEILLYRESPVPPDKDQVLERYALQVGATPLNGRAIDDAFLLRFEEQLRASLYKMAGRLKPLRPLPKDSKFKMLLHTNQSGFVRLSHDPQYQEFPWLHSGLPEDCSAKQHLSLLPLTAVSAIGLQFEALIATTPDGTRSEQR